MAKIRTAAYPIYSASEVAILAYDLTGSERRARNWQSSAPFDVFVKQCDFTGVSNSLRAMTPVTNLEATECPGYNDQATVLQSTIPPLANPITNPEPLVQTFLRAGSGTSCFMSRNAVDVTNRRLRYEPDRWWIHVGASGESASIAGTATDFLVVGGISVCGQVSGPSVSARLRARVLPFEGTVASHAIAVGTRITARPPRRSERAVFPHSAVALSI